MTPSISLRLRSAARSRTLAFIASTVLPFAWLATSPTTAMLEGEGENGQVLTAEYDSALSVDGTDVTVVGSGYEESKGIYLAVCVDNGEGERPTPCIGGVNMAGDGGASVWISSNPPSYGKDLVTPFGPDGSFEFDYVINSGDDTTDCLDPADAPNGCVLATYADHTRLDDRSADVRIPLDFSETAPEPDETTSEPTAEETTAEATETATETPEPSTEATEPAAAADTDEKPSGTPPEFWLWISLAAIALIGAVAVIRAKARKNMAQDGPESPEPDTPHLDERDGPDA